VADQLTKWWIQLTLAVGEEIPLLPVLKLVRWHNEGAAFSLFSSGSGWQRWFFITLAIVFTVFIVMELRRLPLGDRLMAFSYSLILGGALGNMTDRLVLGHVVDFVRFHYGGWGFPAFNVADSALFCGAVLWIGILVVSSWRERKMPESAG
jgi:signal peptidase II